MFIPMKTTMKRNTIIMTAQHVAVTGSRVWMRADEIATLFDTTAAAVERTIRSLWKQGLLNADEQMRSLPSGGGCTVDVYGMEVILALAFRIDTCHTAAFRRWAAQKAVARDIPITFLLAVDSRNVQ